MKRSSPRRRRRTMKINGVSILNARKVTAPRKNDPNVPFNDKNLIWISDKDNLEL